MGKRCICKEFVDRWALMCAAHHQSFSCKFARNLHTRFDDVSLYWIKLVLAPNIFYKPSKWLHMSRFDISDSDDGIDHRFTTINWTAPIDVHNMQRCLWHLQISKHTKWMHSEQQQKKKKKSINIIYQASKWNIYDDDKDVIYIFIQELIPSITTVTILSLTGRQYRPNPPHDWFCPPQDTQMQTS